MTGMKELTNVQEVDALIAESKKKPVFIFKHSAICPISFNALAEYEVFVKGYTKNNINFRIVMIRDHRDVSNAIAEKLGVKHESPQAIFVENGKAIWDDSHYEITTSKLQQVVMMYENGDIKA